MNYYSEVIGLLVEQKISGVNAMEIIAEIAKKHPKAVTDAYKFLKGAQCNLEKEIETLIKDDKFIGAIKLYREKTNVPLTIAKVAVEDIRDKMMNLLIKK